MIQEFKEMVLTNWNVMRIIRGVLSLIIVVQAVMYHDVTLGIFGGVFAVMTLFNTGCCAGGACAPATPSKNVSTKGSDNIEFEEIK